MGAACTRAAPRESLVKGEHQAPVPVTLNIYDVGTSGEVYMVNRLLRPLGAGAFHCGVEAFGQEWSYGDYAQGSGVFSCPPRACDGHSYCESVAMGKTTMSEEDFLTSIKILEFKWQGADYDILKKNCCHFCQRLLRVLAVGDMPHWVTNLAGAGAAVTAVGEELAARKRSLSELVAATFTPVLCCGCEMNTTSTRQQVEVIPVSTNARQLLAQRVEDGGEPPPPPLEA